MQYCVQQLCTCAMHTHMTRHNSCLLVIFSISTVILRVTVYLYYAFWDYFVLVYLCMCGFVVLGVVSSVLCQEIGQEERLRNDLSCVEWDVKP